MQLSISRVFLPLVLAVSIILTGCGFHLRGQIDVPPSLMRMHVKGDDIELVNEVEKSLKFSSIEIVEEGAADAALLDLSGTTYEKEVNDTDASGIATSYKLTYTVPYVVRDAEQELLQREKLHQNRTLSYDAADILVFEREEQYLVEEMRKDLISQLLRRMSKIQ